MSALNKSEDERRHCVRLLIEFLNVTRSSVAEASGIKRPNLVGWLNGRNGISHERLQAVMRTLHIADGCLDAEMVHRWSVSRWDDLRQLIDVLLEPDEKEKVEIFHLGRGTAKPVAILRCTALSRSSPYHAPSEFNQFVIITPAALAPPLGLLTDAHIGCGTVRAKEPEITEEALAEIGFIDLAVALCRAHNEAEPEDFDTSLLSSIMETDETLEREVYSTVKLAGRDNTRFMLGLAARDPDTARALQAALQMGYTDAQIRGWVELLTSKPEFSRVLVDALT